MTNQKGAKLSGVCDQRLASQAVLVGEVRWFRCAVPLGFVLAGCGGVSAPPSGRVPEMPATTSMPAGALVAIESVAPTVMTDMRYATTDNFAHEAVYAEARCLLRPEVAERIARVEHRVEAAGYRLKVWDCYRPFSVQQRFWKLVPDERYVARPVVEGGRPVEGSRHNRAAAVDITLVTADGAAVEMPTAHDDFTEAAAREGKGWSAEAKAHYDILDTALRAEGFTGLPTEWWHYDAPGWEAYELLDAPLE
ncbi:MAG: M15 family metallopeptidase [Polyangiales bacterium]|nr:M15 family metallopeptidase [Myxococcales bacterium]